MPNINQLGGIGQSILGNTQPMRNEAFQHHESDEELIPTAIVIKNIPFAVKKEQLHELMQSMGLPVPYAFNYHFDSGVFRGLAFANFTSPEETAMVIENLNGFDLHGRKLRVEYKKMLPQQERERIERAKRERRGQLEEQHRSMVTPNLHNQQSMSSLSSHVPATSPSPVSSRTNANAPGEKNFADTASPLNALGLDLNDPETLQFYNEIFMFKADKQRETLIFPATLSPPQRRLVHTIAHFMGLSHASRGNGEQRQVHVYRDDEHVSPLLQQGMGMGQDPNRRALNRAATTDFAESRMSDPSIPYAQLRGQQSNGFLGIPDSPGGILNQNANLRGAKSFADLRSYTPSPAQSTASFPVGLQSNIARFQDNTLGTATSATPTMNASMSVHSHESLITNGLGNMTIGTSIANGGSPRRARTGMPWDDLPAPTAPIGTNRSFMSNFDDSRNPILPSRQPRGPAIERGQGFTTRARQNGHQQRNSDELRQQSSSNLATLSVD